MSRMSLLVLLAAVGAGGYYFLTRYQVEGWDHLELTQRPARTTGQPGDGTDQSGGNGKGALSRSALEKKSLRIATVNLGPLDRKKLNTRHVAARLVDLFRRYHIVAVQDVRSHTQGLMLDLVQRINADGAKYDFAIPPRVGREPVEQYSAFVFDSAAVDIDRETVYEVGDPSEQFVHRPLVASFRAAGPPPLEAFTFTLVNVQVEPTRLETELRLLADVFRAVRDDGRGEDDVILLGYLGVDERHLGELGEVPNLMWCVTGIPTTTRGTRLSENILFDSRATVEFNGRSGVTDLISELDMTIREAVEVSEHLPVWAEFSLFEGGQIGGFAEDPQGEPPR